MATRPPTIYAREIGWPPSKRPDAAHYWVLDHAREKLVECDKEPHLLIPLVKVYEDPYGLTDKIERKPLEDVGGCHLCHSLFVSQSSNIKLVENQLMVSVCTNANLCIHPSCSAKKDPGAWPIYPPFKRRKSGATPE